MPRVLFLTESQNWSGGAKQLLALGDGLRQAGWEVVLAAPGDGETFRKAGERGFETIDFHPRQDYDVFSALRLARLMGERRIDVLHAHHPRAHAVGLIAVYLLRHPPIFLVTRRVSFPVSRHVFSRFKYCSPRISGYVAVAESIRTILIDAGVPSEKVTTIPSGVDLEAFSPRPKDSALAGELSLPDGVPVVGLIANFGSWKGQDVLLDAAGILKRRGIQAVYVLAGRDTQSPALIEKARSLGLGEEDVRFLGFRQDVPRILSVLDVSVNASTAGEGLSGALRESLAMGIPVAASDVGGNRELVEDGVTGKLFARGDAGALAEALAGLFQDLPGARKMAEEGRRRVGERFGTERMVSATVELYRSLLSRAASEREPFEYVV